MWNTKNTDENGVNKQNMDVNQTLWEKEHGEGLVSMKIKILPFLKQPPIYQSLPFYTKNLNPPLWENYGSGVSFYEETVKSVKK